MLVVCGSTVLTTYGDKKSGGLLRVPPLLYVAATYSPTCAVPSA